MPRPRNAERKVPFDCWLTETLRARIDLKLFDPLIGKPRGYSDFAEAAFRRHLDYLEGKEPVNVFP